MRVVKKTFTTLLRGDVAQTKRRGPRGDPRLPFLIVAGGFGGSGDDQSSLVQGRGGDRHEHGEGDGEGDQLEHVRLQNSWSELLMQLT